MWLNIMSRVQLETELQKCPTFLSFRTAERGTTLSLCARPGKSVKPMCNVILWFWAILILQNHKAFPVRKWVSYSRVPVDTSFLTTVMPSFKDRLRGGLQFSVGLRWTQRVQNTRKRFASRWLLSALSNPVINVHHGLLPQIQCKTSTGWRTMENECSYTTHLQWKKSRMCCKE